MRTRTKRLLAGMGAVLMLAGSACSAAEPGAFSDVPAGAYYARSVAWCREEGLLTGTSATTFSPNTPTTRGQLVTILWRQQGSPAGAGTAAFSDVVPGAYYADAVAWAAKEGVVGGYADGTFRPDTPVSRVQLAAILWRVSGRPAASGAADFPDGGEIPAYGVPAAAWAKETGVLTGTDGGRFAPNAPATRGQTATILHRWLTAAPTETSKEATTMDLQVNGTTFSVTLADTQAARELARRLASGPITLELQDYSGFEKVGPLGFSLPAENRQTTTQSGDIVLYNGNQMVIFYGSNAWAYTRLGRVDDLSGWETALGSGAVQVVLSVSEG